jgi:hypothetical protein
MIRKLYNLLTGRCQQCNRKKKSWMANDWCSKCDIQSFKERKLGMWTNKKFLTGIIPKEWEEDVYKGDKYWSIQVKGKYLRDSEWNTLFASFVEEFGEHLLEVYSISSNGSHFIVYLKNDLK